VIVPAYNTAPFIAETLDSVFAQSMADFEVIVVNDGSPDTPALEQALLPYRDRIRYIVQSNGGLSAARNTAIRASGSELVAFLDSDDVWEPDYLQHQVQQLDERGLTVVYPDATLFGDTRLAGRRFMDIHPSSGPVTIESLVTQRCNVMVSVVARRQAIVDAGMFDDSLRSSEDFDLWLRIVRMGGHIGYHRRPLVRSRVRGDSLSANGVSMCQHILRVLDKAVRELDLSPREREVIADRRRDFAAMLRFHEGKRAFLSGSYDEAATALTDANHHLSRTKLTIAVALMRLMPRVLLKAYDLRARIVFGAVR
jgi:glycosyltransferase involved in cell wall biosynthesis